MRRELSVIEQEARPPLPLGDPARRSLLADMLQDVRYAGRVLRRNPAFATLAVLTLALGVGATTIVYAIVDNMLLRAMPYDNVERLVRVFETEAGRPTALISASYPNLLDWQGRSRSFDAFGVYQSRSLILIDGEPERVQSGTATRGFLEASGALPVLGRTFTDADSSPSAPRVVILSHGAWLRRFGGDASVIGRSIRTTDGPYEVVGVLGPVRMFGGDLELWTPLRMSSANMRRDVRGSFVLARLRKGVTLEQARAEMDRIASSLASEHAENRGWGVRLMPMQEWRARGVTQPLYTFLGAVLCILLIACANVAGLLVARGAGRVAEIAIRTSLGAERRRILRQLMTESLVIALLGGSVGGLLAWLTIGSLLPLFPVALPAAWIAVDLRVVAIAIATSAITGVLFGLAPALALSRIGTAAALKEQARSSPRWGYRIGSGLIVVEVALSLMLLAGAGLLVRTLVNVYAVDPGLDPDRLVALHATPLVPADAPPARAHEFYRQLLDRVASAPGVEAAAAISTPPFGGSTLFSMVVAEPTSAPVGVSPRSISPGYFSALGIPLVAGRDFTDADIPSTARVVVVNQTTAAKLWGNQNPLGRQLRFSARGTLGEPFEVIGVAADARHDGLDYDVLPEIYQPFTHRTESDLTIIARAGDPDRLGRSFPELTNGLPERALVRPPRTVAAMIKATVEQRRHRTILLGILAALGLLLAAVGIFGLTAYTVAQRTREIGVRMALGADRWRVLRTVIGAQTMPLVAGIALGLMGAWWATRALRAFLFGVEPLDPVSFTVAAVLMVAATLLACYVPARRALRVDPVVALRAE